MNKFFLSCLFILMLFNAVDAQPVALHPENSHYLIFNKKPLVLVTSAEHYGSVINQDFNYKKYLETMHKEGLNYTRIFTGSYVEIPGSFGIENNTLAPAVGRFLAPWKRTEEAGLYKGEKKFDLEQWNTEYFSRLKDFVSRAADYNIIVEVTLFCSTYQDASWERHPFNAGNNVNKIAPTLVRQKSNTLDNGKLLSYQKNMVEKIVTELNDFDNVFYEIQNEPWSDNPKKVMRTLRTHDPQPGQGSWYKWAEMASPASLEWQKVMVQIIVNTENNLPKKHLIAQNYTNFFYSVDKVDPHISILNFHYAWPEAVWLNYGWNRIVNFDESGFAGSSDSTYLRQAWQFMMAGGGIFNSIDYSFYTGFEDGTGKNKAPGGGSINLRKQLAGLRSFLESFDFVKMKPDFNVVVHSPGLQSQVLSEPGKQYAFVFTGQPSKWVKLDLPKGQYNYEFVSPYDGRILKKGFFFHNKKGIKEIYLPEFGEMVVLKMVK